MKRILIPLLFFYAGIKLLAQCPSSAQGNGQGTRMLLNYDSETARDSALAQISSITIGMSTFNIEAHPNNVERIRTTPLALVGTFPNPFTDTLVLNLDEGATLECVYVDNALLRRCATTARGNTSGNRFLLIYPNSTARDSAINQFNSITIDGNSYNVEAHPNNENRIRTTPSEPNGTFPNPFSGTITLNLTEGGSEDCSYTDNSLPIGLVSFEATLIQSEVIIRWETAFEWNHEMFDLERSSDGVHWFSKIQIPGSGNSNELRAYKYIDQHPMPSNYYRLKSQDWDGSIAFSEVIQVTAPVSNRLLVFPNPARGSLYLKQFDDTSQYRAISTNGQVFALVRTGNRLNIEPLPKGIYVLIDDSRSFTKRFSVY